MQKKRIKEGKRIMRTPKKWSDNLRNKIITDEMLEAALFSVNKRAKNYRDKKREYQHKYTNTFHDYSAPQAAKEEEMYQKKEELLSLLTPICVHEEFWGYERTRHYSYQSGFEKKLVTSAYRGVIVHDGSFIRRIPNDYNAYSDWYDDYGDREIVYFFDTENINQPKGRKYLYYVLGDHSYHTPLTAETEKQYANLPCVFIGKLNTAGEEIDDLVSLQFVQKLLNLIRSGDYRYDGQDLSNEQKETLIQAGAIDKDTFLKERRKDLIRKNVSEYEESIIESMQQYAIEHPPKLIPRLTKQERDAIGRQAYQKVSEQLEPCFNSLRTVLNAAPEVSYKKVNHALHRLKKAADRIKEYTEPWPYEETEMENFVEDSIKRFGGYGVSIQELAETYPDPDYPRILAESRALHEAEQKALIDQMSEFRSTIDMAKQYVKDGEEARKRAKQERKARKRTQKNKQKI